MINVESLKKDDIIKVSKCFNCSGAPRSKYFETDNEYRVVVDFQVGKNILFEVMHKHPMWIDGYISLSKGLVSKFDKMIIKK